MKLQELRGRFFLTIPKSIAVAKGWKKGDELITVFNAKGELVIQEVKQKR